MSTLKINRTQLGQSNTATNNFTLTAEAADGTMKLARGNAGATTQDVITVDSSGLVNFPQGISSTNNLPVFSCRAWAVFNGQTTGTNSPIASGNISTVQRVSTGVYRCSFTTPMLNTNYCVNINSAGTPGYNCPTVQVNSRTTTYVEIGSIGITGTTQAVADSSFLYVSIFQ